MHISTKTGFKLQFIIDRTVEIQVIAGTITSEFFGSLKAFKLRYKASVPLAQPTVCLDLQYLEYSPSNFLTASP